MQELPELTDYCSEQWADPDLEGRGGGGGVVVLGILSSVNCNILGD